jgi:hypothetical protein
LKKSVKNKKGENSEGFPNLKNCCILYIGKNMEAVQTARPPQTATPPSIKTYEAITGKQQLYNLLEEADNDIENGNFLTEEEMKKEINLM